MLGKLIEIIVGAKSGALSGVLIVAGAVVTVSSGNGVTTVTIEHPSPSPAVETSAEPKPSPLEVEEEDEDQGEPREENEKERATAPSPESCADEAQARNEARQKVHDGYVKYHAAIEHLRSQRKTDRALETLKKADELIKEIAEKAERVLHEMGRCMDQDRDEMKDRAPDNDGDEDEDADTDEEEDAEAATLVASAAGHVDADASSMQQVAERAVAAMETVYNLAKGAAEATPTPKPTAKPTEKPKQTEKARATPKPSKTPSCESRLYENKLKMAAAFEKYHSLHDKIYATKYGLPEALRRVVIANDELMHRTYDKAKSEILSSGCAGDLGAAAAARAAATFERAYYDSAQAIANSGR